MNTFANMQNRQIRRAEDESTIHLVAKCCWNTQFDSELHAHQVQEQISQFSQVEMTAILDRVFSQYYPRSETLRLDSLNIDLGVVDFSPLNNSLNQNLASKLETSLHRFFQRMFDQQSIVAASSIDEHKVNRRSVNGSVEAHMSSSDARISSKTFDSNMLDLHQKDSSQVAHKYSQHSAASYIGHFLISGTAPWWYRKNESNHEMLSLALSESPVELKNIIKQIGRQDIVRQRIVSQWQLRDIEKLIELVEPAHSRVILKLLDVFREIQSWFPTRYSIAESQKITRKWALEYMLCYSSRAFSEQSFLRFMLKRIAEYQRISPLSLVELILGWTKQNTTENPELAGLSISKTRLIPIESELKAAVLNAAMRLDADLSISSKSHGHLQTKEFEESKSWEILDQYLTGKKLALSNSAKPFDSLSSLLQRLCISNRVRLIQVLKAHSRKSNLGAVFAIQLSHQEKILMVNILAPGNESFVTDYALNISKSNEYAEQPVNIEASIVWQVIFTHLLNDEGSVFNRRQFVQRTLLEIAQQQSIDFMTLLYTLIANMPQLGGSDAAKELNTLFCELRDQDHTPERQSIDAADVYFQTIVHYLSSGDSAKLNTQQNSADKQMVMSLLLNSRGSDLVHAFKLLIQQSANSSDAVLKLSNRLMRITGVQDFGLLVKQIAPNKHSFLMYIVGRLQHWNAEGKLPSMRGFDCSYDLHQLVLGIVVNSLNANFSSEQLFSELLRNLNKHHGVDPRQLSAELQNCLDLSVDHRAIDIDESKGFKKASDYDRSKTKNVHKRKLAQCISKGIITLEDVAGRMQKSLQGTVHEDVRFELPEQVNPIELLRRFSMGAVSPGQAEECSKYLGSLSNQEIERLLRDIRGQSDRSELLKFLQGLEEFKLSTIRVRFASSQYVPTEEIVLALRESFKNYYINLGSKPGYKGAIDKSSVDKDHSDSVSREQFEIASAKMLSNEFSFEFERRVTALVLDGIAAVQPTKNNTSQTKISRNLIVGLCGALNIQVQDYLSVLNETRSSEVAVLKDIVKATDAAEFEKIDQHATDHIVISELLLTGQAPIWRIGSKVFNSGNVIRRFALQQPRAMKVLLATLVDDSSAIFRLTQILSTEDLLIALSKESNLSKSFLSMLGEFHQSLGKLSLGNVSGRQLQQIFFLQLIRCWLNNNWTDLEPTTIVWRLDQKLLNQYGLTRHRFSLAFEKNKAIFPSHISSPYPEIDSQETTLASSKASSEIVEDSADIASSRVCAFSSKLEPIPSSTQRVATPLAVSNAGIVLLQSYIKMYFERLDLLEGDDFSSPLSQQDAVHHLQYLVTGRYQTDEQHLPLNKLLCGLNIGDPIDLTISESSQAPELADGLIQAMIDYWPAIGSSSIDGFRGNWLARNGSLRERDESWELAVETKPYDLLINQAPVTFALIKLPWMSKAISVNWAV